MGTRIFLGCLGFRLPSGCSSNAAWGFQKMDHGRRVTPRLGYEIRWTWSNGFGFESRTGYLPTDRMGGERVLAVNQK